MDSGSYTVPEMRGNGDFTVTLASTVVEHVPIWAPSIEQWEFDISLSGDRPLRVRR